MALEKLWSRKPQTFLATKAVICSLESNQDLTTARGMLSEGKKATFR